MAFYQWKQAITIKIIIPEGQQRTNRLYDIACQYTLAAYQQNTIVCKSHHACMIYIYQSGDGKINYIQNTILKFALPEGIALSPEFPKARC